MPEQLEIEDGDPWYMSPDIWAVPGPDPNGEPGQPRANQGAWLWARVHNKGKESTSSARVNYYWADPSTLVTRETAHLVGYSQVSLAPGETKEVLCLTQWIPSFVNDGHECLICEAYSPSDPIIHGPNDYFNVREDRHVAQRNISVLPPPSGFSNVVFMFSAAQPKNEKRHEVRLVARRAPLATIKNIAKTIGLKQLPKESKSLDSFGLVPYRCGQPVKEVGEREVTLRLAPGDRVGMAFIMEATQGYKEGEAVLFLVEQFAGDDVTGGIAILIGSLKTPETRKGNKNV